MIMPINYYYLEVNLFRNVVRLRMSRSVETGRYKNLAETYMERLLEATQFLIRTSVSDSMNTGERRARPNSKRVKL